MKILFDHQIFDAQVFGGISRYFGTLISGLDLQKEVKVKVSVLYTENYYLKDKRAWKLANSFGNLVFKRKNRISKWNKVYSRFCISKDDFDIFHPTYYHPYFLKTLKKPFVLTVHDMIHELFPEYFGPEDITAANKKLLVAAAKHIIAISETTRIDLMRLLDVPSEKITVVYHGHTLIKNDYKRSNELPAHYILFIGGREGYKNFESLAIAVALVMKNDPELKMVCAGGGHFTEAEITHLLNLDILDRTVQYNASDDMLYTMYKNAKAFVYPSLYEGFGLPILEAFEAECPVILSKTPCFIEVAGEAAVYMNTADKDEMAATIEMFLTNETLRANLISEGKKRLQNFSMEKCLRETMEVYSKCLLN